MWKMMFFILILMFSIGCVCGCTGWKYDENGNSYYQVYDDNGTPIHTGWMNKSTNKTTNITPNQPRNINLNKYKTK